MSTSLSDSEYNILKNVLKCCIDKDSINELSLEMREKVLSYGLSRWHKIFHSLCEIPQELKIFRYNDQTVEFSSYIGIVTKVSRYSRTSINGSGGGGSISTSYGGYTSGYISPINIRGKSFDVLDIWVKTFNGDVNCQLINPNVSFLEGDPVKFMLVNYSSLEPPKTVTFSKLYKNNNLYSWCMPGRPYIILKTNPSGLFKNPQKRQDEYDDALAEHEAKIANYLNDHISSG